MSPSTTVRVGLTVEQCWQPVPGGSGTYIARLSAAMDASVELVGIAARHRRAPDPDFAPTLTRLVSAPWPRAALYEAWNRWRAPRAEGITRGGLDVVHATTWAVVPTRLPLVVTVHDLAFLDAPEMFTPRGVRFFQRALERVRVEADVIVVPSEATFRACVAAGLPSERMRVVPHGVDMPDVTPQEVAAFRREHGLERPYVLWCGTLEPRKNVQGVLAGFGSARGRMPGHDLVLVGPSGWGDQPDRGPDVGDGVHWLGKLSRHHLACAYAGADVFCYPSFAEGFGLPVLEAMAYGVPVVTSLGTPMVELVGGTGLAVDPADDDAIAAALVAAHRERDDRTGPARERAKSFTWAAAATATAAVYRELT